MISGPRVQWLLRRLCMLEVLVGSATLVTTATMIGTFVEHYHSALAAFAMPGLSANIWNTLVYSGVTALLVALAGYVLAYFLNVYVARHRANHLLLLFLLPYISSYYLILLGWRLLWGKGGLFQALVPPAAPLFDQLSYGGLALIGVMTLRYLPLAMLLIFLRLRGLSGTQVQAARNLGITGLDIHTKLCLPWCAGVIAVVCVFTLALTSLDLLASSLAGGGQIQILADLIDTWHRTHALQGAAMGLGVAYIVAVVGLMLVCWRVFILTPQQRSAAASSTSRSFGLEALVLGIFGLGALMSEGAQMIGVLYGASPIEKSWHTLWSHPDVMSALAISLSIAGWSCLAGTVLACVSAFSKHVRNSVNVSPRLVEPGELFLLIPLVVPPLLAGVAGGNVQRVVFDTAGSATSVIIAHVIVFAPLAYFVISGALSSLSTHSYLAARNLGISNLNYVLRIFIPELWPAMAAGALLIFAFSMNDPILARYVGGLDKPLGVFIADAQASGPHPELFLIVLALPVFTSAILAFLALVLANVSRRPIEVTQV